MMPLSSSTAMINSLGRPMTRHLRRGIAAAAWSGRLKFASAPESEFTSDSFPLVSMIRGPSFSSDISFSSPESDFCSVQARQKSTLAPHVAQGHSSPPVWSGTISFTSPESDFAAATDLAGTRKTLSSSLRVLLQPEWSGHLSYATPESDFCSKATLPQRHGIAALPQTYSEALMEERVPIVITTAAAPHKIVHVNHAWEALCGYRKDEVLDKTLGLIQGRDTNVGLIQAQLRKVLNQYTPADMYLINYKKSGESFVNHVSVGPLKLNRDEPSNQFLVGILEQVRPEDVPLRMVTM